MRSCVFACTLIIAVPVLADDAPKSKQPAEKPKKLPVETFTNPEKAGPDFRIQGEYTGTGPDGRVAVQVIAEGDGKFTCRALHGGLPGDGWDGKNQIKFPAKTVDGKTTFAFDSPAGGRVIRGEIRDGKITATDRNGAPIELNRIVRHSPTEGMAPPASAIVLFDGKNADAWDHGKIEDGLLTVKVPNGQTSKQKFADCTVHVEFLLPFMPRAREQGRANSGVYLQGRYEVQVLDSFGLAGKNNECGGIYELSDPLTNMCYPPLQWQTYDIEYKAARYDASGKKTEDAVMTVRHNGVVVQDHFKIKRDTRGAVTKEGAAAGPIHLQNHGNPVMYRNIWVVEKK